MQTVLTKVNSKAKVKVLVELLKDMNFVTEVRVQSDDEPEEAAEEHEEMKQVIVSRKNKAIAKYLK